MLIPVAFTKKKKFSILDNKFTTWHHAICSLLEEYGAMSMMEITEKLMNFYPVKCSTNKNVDAKVRQTIYRYPSLIKKIGNTYACA